MRPYPINLSYKPSPKVAAACNLDPFEINLIDIVVFH